jgi:hypothetical protein
MLLFCVVLILLPPLVLLPAMAENPLAEERPAPHIDTMPGMPIAQMPFPPTFRRLMLSQDDFHYAIENTHVVRAPENRIQTFGSTQFRFFLVTELMDSVNRVRVRDGRLHAERPQIITPDYLHGHALEGFGEKAEEFLGWLKANAKDLAILKYGFQFKKTDISEETVHCPIEDVIGRLKEEVARRDDPMSTIIQGVDEGWEVCLLKFAADLIQQSAPDNLGDWKKRGLF